MNYGINPSPTTGTNAYGMVPGAIGLPNPAADLSAQFPNLNRTNSAVSTAINDELGGRLSQGTQDAIWNARAEQAVSAGMPGSGAYQGTVFGNATLRDLGLTAEQQRRFGLQDYGSILPVISSTQTVNPALQVEVADRNAALAAAPNPAMAAMLQQQLFQEYLNSTSGGGGGGPAGGTGGFNENDFIASLGAGSRKTGPGTYFTPYMP